MTITMYSVGGSVRDELLGVTTKDLDFTCVATGGWNEMKMHLEFEGFEIFVESPQYLTVRARFPKHITKFGGWDIAGMTADFVLARKEGEYTDGRRPDLVEPGTLEDDLRRRDFTVNALAKDRNGQIIDLFGGMNDLDAKILRCVGSAEDRIREDALRALRALRFAVTKGFTLDDELWVVMRSDWLPGALASVSVERKQQELHKAFRHNTLETLACLNQLTQSFREAIFTEGLWLLPTLKG